MDGGELKKRSIIMTVNREKSVIDARPTITLIPLDKICPPKTNHSFSSVERHHGNNNINVTQAREKRLEEEI